MARLFLVFFFVSRLSAPLFFVSIKFSPSRISQKQSNNVVYVPRYISVYIYLKRTEGVALLGSFCLH